MDSTRRLILDSLEDGSVKTAGEIYREIKDKMEDHTGHRFFNDQVYVGYVLDEMHNEGLLNLTWRERKLMRLKGFKKDQEGHLKIGWDEKESVRLKQYQLRSIFDTERVTMKM